MNSRRIMGHGATGRRRTRRFDLHLVKRAARPLAHYGNAPPFVAFSRGWLPSPPVTRNQVELMRVDTASSPGMPGFGELGISPRSVEDMLRELLQNESPRSR
jgi:hypothetical protein